MITSPPERLKGSLPQLITNSFAPSVENFEECVPIFQDNSVEIDTEIINKSTIHCSGSSLNLESEICITEELYPHDPFEELTFQPALELQHGLDLTQSWKGEEDLQEVFTSMLIQPEDREFEAEAEECEESSGSVDGEPLLYTGAPLSLHESFTSILTLALTHKLSGAALQAVLDLLAIHLPKLGNIFKSSLSFFKNYFSYLQGPKAFEYYCSKCFQKCADKSGCDVCKGSKVCYLVRLSLIQQLQTMFAREGFYSKLCFSNQKHSGTYQDIYDGSVYQDLVNKGILGKDGRLSGQLYADGAALYVSANVSVWPVFVNINELPYEDRFKKQNILLPVLWCGPTKPPINLLLSAAFPDLQALANGVKLEAKNVGEKEVKLIIISATGDTPARGMMLNMCQFNGANSCQCCEQSGEPRPNCPGVRLFPYKPSEMKPRTVASMEACGKKGTESKPCLGAKGPTVLSKIMPDFVNGMAIDPMHHIYAGLGRRVATLLKDTTSKSKKWSISNRIEEINKKLLSIKPPVHIPRVPRALSEVANWKCSELKAWVLHYSLPVLDGILDSNYMKHHATLVAAIQLLSGDAVSANDIPTARNLLHEYVAQFSDFYHPYFATINLHLLLHLAALVERLGPLWVPTCFPLEALIGEILDLVHGTRWADKQIASSVQLTLGLPDIVANLTESKAKAYCLKLLSPRRYGGIHIGDAIIVGKSVEVDLEYPVISCLKDQYTIMANRAKKFASLKKGKYLYVSSLNKISKCRDSSLAAFVFNGLQEVGSIQYFIDVNSCSCTCKCDCVKSIFAVIRKFVPIRFFSTLVDNVVVPNTFVAKETDEILVVPKKALSGVCVCMMFDDGEIYVSKPTNSKESE